MAKKLFIYNLPLNDTVKNIPFPEQILGFEASIFEPKILNLSQEKGTLLKDIAWFILSFGQYKIVYLRDGNTIVHSSYLIPKNIRFPFMGKNDLQIGPCYTNENYRGKGIYTTVLKLIPQVLAEPNRTFWIFTTEHNFISQRAIERSGYLRIGSVIPEGFLRVLKNIF
jgi:RimJ/RimL family protein N-acetyltransferase